jgi:hypothetical protein
MATDATGAPPPEEDPPPADASGEAGPPAEVAPDGEVDGPDPLRFNRWRKESATGAVLTGVALGLQQALERRDQRPAFVIEAPGEPEDEQPLVRLQFDPDDPTKTVAVVRRTDDPVDPDDPVDAASNRGEPPDERGRPSGGPVADG